MSAGATANKELTTRLQRIREALTERFAPTALEVMDESVKHAGHAGAAPGGETHFKVVIRAPLLSAMPRIARHRAVTDALAEEFRTGLHALSIDAA